MRSTDELFHATSRPNQILRDVGKPIILVTASSVREALRIITTLSTVKYQEEKIGLRSNFLPWVISGSGGDDDPSI